MLDTDVQRDDLRPVARQLADLLRACAGAELVLVRNGRVRSLAASDDHVGMVASTRSRTVAPAVEADFVTGGGTLVAGSSEAWGRYWQALAADGGFRSITALPLAAEDDIVPAVVLHSTGDDPLDGAPCETLGLLSDLAGAQLRVRVLREKADNLEVSLRNGRRIGMAMGILIERLRITEDAAFALLKTTSQRTNVKLRDIAERILVTGELPAPIRG